METKEQGRDMEKKYMDLKNTVYGALIGSGIGFIVMLVYNYFMAQLPK